MQHSEIEATAPEQRKLSQLDLGILWFGAAIAITEIWAGGQSRLSSLGLALGLLAILIGRLIGNGLMGAVAGIGAQTGLPTVSLTTPALGSYGSRILAVLNLIQLLGWGGWMIFAGVGYLDNLAGFAGLPSIAEQPGMRYLWAVLIAALCTVWAYFFAGQRVWLIIERLAGALLLLVTIAMTVLVLRQYPPSQLLAGSGALTGLLPGVDLVVAMSVSWLPLVADYSRFAASQRSAVRGTFWGYTIGGCWMYAVGLLVAVATGQDTPDMMVVNLLGSQSMGWAVLAIVLVLISTVTTTFLDIYSAVVNAQIAGLRLKAKTGTLLVGLLSLAIGVLLSASAYESFLFAIGLVFLPAFIVALASWTLGTTSSTRLQGQFRPPSSDTGPAPLHWPGLLAWLIGAVVYDAAGGWGTLNYFLAPFGAGLTSPAWSLGSTLPCIAATLLAYLLLRRLSSVRAVPSA